MSSSAALPRHLNEMNKMVFQILKIMIVVFEDDCQIPLEKDKTFLSKLAPGPNLLKKRVPGTNLHLGPVVRLVVWRAALHFSARRAPYIKKHNYVVRKCIGGTNQNDG